MPGSKPYAVPRRGLLFRVVVGLTAIVATFAVAGCGPKASANSSKASAAVQSLQADPAVQAAQATLQKKFQACSAKNSLWTKAGRNGFVACMAPASDKATVEACLQKTATKDGIVTKAQRKAFMDDVLKNCVPAS